MVAEPRSSRRSLHADPVRRTWGAPASFEELFESQRVPLFKALCLLTGDRQEAEDIAQDAFVRVLERWERVGGLEDPVGYLYRTAMNGYRSRTRRARVAVRRQPRDRSQVDGLEQAEERARLMRQLSRLDPHQRAVLVLTDLIGFTADETARITGSTAGAVRTRASRARRALRSMEEEKDA